MMLLLDDFRDAAQVAQRWSAFTDRVMGGQSVARAALTHVRGEHALRLTGHVSLANNGGFVQMARQLGGLDASPFSGIQLRVCGAPGPYFVHLRTGDTRAPWQYYGAPLSVKAEWTDVYLPWQAFTPVSLSAPLDVRRLERLGVVAAKQAFEADVALSRLELAP